MSVARQHNTAANGQGDSHVGPCIAFDVGGTSIRSGVYDASADAISDVRVSDTPNYSRFSDADTDELLERLWSDVVRLAAAHAGDDAPAAISLALPGPLDAEGRVRRLPTILGSDETPGVPAEAYLQGRFNGVEVSVLNDVSAAGYGLVTQNQREFCLITVSSGVGHKVFVDGAPVVGPNGAGGELGHWRLCIDADAPPCECGRRGHLAATSSGRAVQRSVRRAACSDARGFRNSRLFTTSEGSPERIDNFAIAQAFHAGDRWTIELIERAAQPLAQAIAGIHLIVGTERFFIMGGFGQALGNRFCELLGSAAARYAWGPEQSWSDRIQLAPNDPSLALLGAGRFAGLTKTAAPSRRHGN